MDVNSMSREQKEFWGFYLFRFYAHPALYNW
jgi:hypothetical protein